MTFIKEGLVRTLWIVLLLAGTSAAATAVDTGDADAVRIAVFQHYVDHIRESTGLPQPVFVALGESRARRDPSQRVLRGLGGTDVDIRAYSRKRAFERNWLSTHHAPPGDSEAHNTGTVISIESLAFGSTTEAEATVRINWYAVGRGDYGSIELRHVALVFADGVWRVTEDEVITAAG